MRSRTAVIVLLALVAVGAPAHAQVIGSFPWQTQPYCNVVTLTVIQQGGLFQLAGIDNLCGGGTASVTGTAVQAGSNVVLGFTVALASGGAAHISATIDTSTLSGTWIDGDGNTGAFLFAGSTGGSPRPAPASAAAITVNQFAPSVYGGTGGATTVARSDHDHDSRYHTQTQLAGLSRAVSGGNGQAVGGSVCTGAGVEVLIRNGFGNLANARFSFIVPEFGYGQIRSDGSIRNGSANLASVEHPSPGAYCLVFSNPQPSQAQAESTVVSINGEQ